MKFKDLHDHLDWCWEHDKLDYYQRIYLLILITLVEALSDMAQEQQEIATELRSIANCMPG